MYTTQDRQQIKKNFFKEFTKNVYLPCDTFYIGSSAGLHRKKISNEKLNFKKTK